MNKNTHKSTVEHANLLLRNSQQTLNDASGKLSDKTTDGAMARGKVFELIGYFEEAVESYADALRGDAENDEVAARLSLSLLKAGHFAKALASAMTLAARNPNFQLKALATDERVSAMTILGDALVVNNRLDDAVHAYEAARKINSKDSYAAGRLAQLYLTAGQPKKAIALSTDFANNPRFGDFSSMLSLGNTSEALLPSFERDALATLVQVTVVGRPLFVEGAPRLAPISPDGDQWCADLTNQNPGE